MIPINEFLKKDLILMNHMVSEKIMYENYYFKFEVYICLKIMKRKP